MIIFIWQLNTVAFQDITEKAIFCSKNLKYPKELRFLIPHPAEAAPDFIAFTYSYL